MRGTLSDLPIEVRISPRARRISLHIDASEGVVELISLGKEGKAWTPDVRVWNIARTAAEIGGQSRQLPTRFINPQGSVYPDSPLVARYEFDWDRGGSTAHTPGRCANRLARSVKSG